ncbi:MAG: hypothetical protein Q4Q17_03585 [Tissierellia bacterium]|nr:hypothetical protein [Tissierellia bacterium]
MIKIIKVETDQQLEEFIELPYKIYKDDPWWVPPLRKEYKKYIQGKTSDVFNAGPAELFIAERDGKTVGRILVGINEHLNAYHGVKDSYFSQYEAVDDGEVAKALYDTAKKWAKEHGSNLLKGPFSLPGGEDNRGFLIDNFEDWPMVQNVYNPPYYNEQVLDNDFIKYRDCYAFIAEPSEDMITRYAKIIPYAMKKYKFRVDPIRLDKEHLPQEAEDIRQIIEQGMPKTEEWIDFMPPSKDEVKIITEAIAPLADKDFIYIARNEEGEPIAFNIAMPDYNQVLLHMNGKMNPWSLLKFLYYKRKMKRLRVFVLFVIPSYRNKGVTQAIYLIALKKAMEKGYQEVEGSTIWDHNVDMKNDILKVGGKLNKTYRIYKFSL